MPNIINVEKLIDVISGFVHSEGYEINKIQYNFVSSSKMQTLNKKFLNHHTETDIITFNYTVAKKIEAEIYLCYSTIIKRAAEHRQVVENEVLRVVSHGVLHCMGYNDVSLIEKKVMRKKEDFFIKWFHVKHSDNV